jgi:CDP-diacylglycerol--glycerol-3-phosphate 3-phosphatidyltransferase
LFDIVSAIISTQRTSSNQIVIAVTRESIMKAQEKNIGLWEVLTLSNLALRVINLITLYRIITFPLLIYLVLANHFSLFKWLLAASFFTDAIDGYLARGFNVSSVLGAKLDSIGDDLTVLAGIVGLVHKRWEFIKEQWLMITILFVLFGIQLTLALLKYKKISSFHTYLAKLAAVASAIFLLSTFFFDLYYWLFYMAVIITAVELIEEIILVIILPKWKVNVKGVYWVLKERKQVKEGR